MIEDLIWTIRFNSGELFCGAVIGFIAAMIIGYILGRNQDDS